jgi:hypothetical protein
MILGSDGCSTDETNSLVEDFADLSVSGQEAVLTAAARIETFRRLGRADQVNALRVAGRLRRSAPEEGVVTGIGSDSSPTVNGIEKTANVGPEDATTSAETLLRARGHRMAAYMRGVVPVIPVPSSVEDWRLLCLVCGAQPPSSIRDCIQVCLTVDSAPYDEH